MIATLLLMHVVAATVVVGLLHPSLPGSARVKEEVTKTITFAEEELLLERGQGRPTLEEPRCADPLATPTRGR